jgi:hypothetical protein
VADLRGPRWMLLKATLLFAIGLITSTLILIERPSWKVAALLAAAVWGFARAY